MPSESDRGGGLKDDLHEGLSTSIDARSGFKPASGAVLLVSKVELFPGRMEALDGSNASGVESATLLRIVGIVFLTN